MKCESSLTDAVIKAAAIRSGFNTSPDMSASEQKGVNELGAVDLDEHQQGDA